MIAAVAAGLGLAASGFGQQSGITAYGVSVRAGVALPFDTALSNYANPLIDLGAEYQFSRGLLPGTDTYLSVDYMSKNFSFGDGVIPICLNERWYLNNEKRAGRRVYAFAGVGESILSIPGSPSDGVITARGGFGSDLNESVFFEIAATLSDKGSTARADTVGFSVGYRF